jgi:hypothetical protein
VAGSGPSTHGAPSLAIDTVRQSGGELQHKQEETQSRHTGQCSGRTVEGTDEGPEALAAFMADLVHPGDSPHVTLLTSRRVSVESLEWRILSFPATCLCICNFLS